MAFLNPLFWLGLLALGAPVWLHLRRRTETNVLPFSTLRFLDDEPAPRRSPLRLQDVLLFLLRALGLILILAAFAWPYLPTTQEVVIRESRVYILDNTLSHQVDNAFVRSRDRIAAEVEKLPDDIQVAVIELGAQPRVTISFGDDRASAVSRLRTLPPLHQRGPYVSAFRQAKSLLDNSLGQQKRIVFYGDHQENQWQENLQIPPFLEHIPVTTIPPSATNAPNLSLAEPRLQRIFLGDKSLINFTAKLTHQSPAAQATVILRANEQVIFNRQLELKREAETVLLSTQWESAPDSWLRGSISVEATPDALPADNTLFFSLAPVREGRVALLAGSEYLRAALSPEVMRGQWTTRVLSPARLAEELAANNDDEALVVESHYLQSSDARKLVWRYLTNRRGVLLLVNRLTPAVSGALRELGFEPQPAEVAKPDMFQYVFSHHPIFHPFLSPDYGNLLEVEVLKHVRLKATDGMPLIFSRSGDPLFFQGTRFPGKLFVMAFGLERDQTSWPVHPTFIPFLDLCLQNARPEDTTPNTYEPAEVSVVSLPVGSVVRDVVLRQHNNELARATVTDGKAQLPLPDQPGLYDVTYDGAMTVEKVFSINPSPKESALAYLAAPDALKVWKLGEVDLGARPRALGLDGPLGFASIWRQEFWWWLLLGAICLLLVEMAWTTLRQKIA